MTALRIIFIAYTPVEAHAKKILDSAFLLCYIINILTEYVSSI